MEKEKETNKPNKKLSDVKKAFKKAKELNS